MIIRPYGFHKDFFVCKGGVDMEIEVKQGQVYRHFKGPFYYVICVGLDSETRERIVVYQHLDGSDMICTRPEKMFLEKIPERLDNITGQIHRFELVDDLGNFVSKLS